MSALIPTVAHRGARNAATIELLDDGPGQAAIHLYESAGGALLAVRKLKKPCGILNAAGQIALQQADEDDLIAAGGDAAHGELVSASGVSVGEGSVTDGAGSGVFKLVSGTTLIAGGVLRLVEPALLG
ncbi:hypothetical protein FVQ98_14015 [Ottowia sp. GY511]|uniref:DUF2190 family protein n=1 Tax=Ottowia flava TaxID=2675430 RepID=A0ABW4KRX8_9BURK|nr:hypothetical protein [Ottowia sp. GY511]TXK26489.1 hypothetical protein FVQ98_14015 [Ottowia sp. GY511]